MVQSKYIYGLLIISLISNIYLIIEYNRNLDNINYLKNNITYLEKNDYRQVLYSDLEKDYVFNHKYENQSDYADAVQLRTKIYENIQYDYEKHLFEHGIIKLNISILGSKEHGNNPVHTLEKIPVYLEESVDSRNEFNPWSEKGYQFNYDIESHTIYLQIDYFKLQQKLTQPPVFIDGYQEDKWKCNGNECVNNGTWFIEYVNQSTFVK